MTEFVTVGDSARSGTSQDGITWSIFNQGHGVQIRGVTYSHDLGLYVAVGAAGGPIWTATDGDGPWTDIGSSIGTCNKVRWSPDLGLFVTGGDNNTLHSSPDGSTWTQRDSPFGGFVRGMCWSPDLGLWVATSAGNAVCKTSPDGVTWTARTTGWDASRNINTACWSPALGLFVIAGRNAAGSPRLCTSPDGITWTARASAATAMSGAEIWACAWAPAQGVFLIVGDSGNAATSSDGVTWTAQSTGSSTMFDVEWSEPLGLFVAVGVSGAIATSPDGVTWTSRTSGTSVNLNGVCWAAAPAGSWVTGGAQILGRFTR